MLYADLTGLPPTMIYYGEDEMVASDAVELAKRAEAAGVDVSLRSVPAGQHSFILGAGRVPEGGRGNPGDGSVAAIQAGSRRISGLASERTSSRKSPQTRVGRSVSDGTGRARHRPLHLEREHPQPISRVSTQPAASPRADPKSERLRLVS